MSSTQRRPDPGVIDRLRAEPYRFEFFQAVRVLSAFFRREGRAQEEVVGERIRFTNSLHIGFAPSEIERLEFDYRSAPQQELAWPEKAAEPALDEAEGVRLTPSFIGMTGNSGVLPRSYTEQLIAREVSLRDRSARAFLDLFSNRAVSLFYRAWEKYRLYFQYERDRQERFLPMMLSLVGVGNRHLRAEACEATQPVLAETLAYYAGALRQSARPGHLIERILADHFAVPVRLEQFAGRWQNLPASEQSALGLANARLGVDTVCGQRMWECGTSIALEIGPLSREQFDRFLPGGEAACAIAHLLSLLAGITVACTVRLVLRKEDVRPAQLGGGMAPARLGHNSWMLTRLTHEHRRDMAYEINHDPLSLQAA